MIGAWQALGVALAGGALALLLATQGQGRTEEAEGEFAGFDAFVENQAERQATGTDSPYRRTLDFTPFEAALDALTPARVAALSALVEGASIPDLQRLMAGGQITAEQLVTLYLYRIRAGDAGTLNSMIELNPDALEIARALDDERTRGVVRSFLHGIPVTLKDNIGTGDALHTSAGSAALAEVRTPRDAFLVASLRNAGAVILGKNNLSEWANFYSSASVNGYSALGGHTRNPHGRFDVGGSSSGSAVAVSAGLTTVAVGSETTGSLVYPASQNGIVTIKPSVGLVSRDLIVPITSAFDTAGPLARSVTDAAFLLNGLAGGIDPADPATQNAAPLFGVDFAAHLDATALQGVRVGLITRPADRQLRHGDDVLHALVRQRLERAGAVIVPLESLDPYIRDIEPPQLAADAFRVLQLGFRLEVEAYLAGIGIHGRTLAEIAAYNNADLPNRMPYGQDLLEASASLTADELAAYDALARRVKATYADAIDRALAENDLAVIADFSNYASPFHSRAGYPAITVPTGYRDTGEPLGITFFAEYLSEPRLIGIAYAYELTGEE